jgi:transposase
MDRDGGRRTRDACEVEHCPRALNILDRFHMVAKLDKALDEARAGASRASVPAR